MSIASVAPHVVTAAESAATEVSPWVVGVGVFVLLLVMLAGLLAFGAGRDHS
jgi:hypothetical protein